MTLHKEVAVITLVPESTDIVSYTPTVAGSTLESAPTTFSIVVTDEAGATLEFSTDPQWNSETKAIELSIYEDDIPKRYLHNVLTFEYYWESDSQVFRDLERAVVVNPNYNDFIDTLRRKLGDLGEVHVDSFVGNGSLTAFVLTNKPIKGVSETVKIDGDTQAINLYTLGYDAGLLTMVSAPSDGSIIEVTYTSYIYSDIELEQYIYDAIAAFNAATGSSASQYEPSVTASSYRLITLYAMRDIYRDRLRNFGGNIVSWRDEEKSVTRARHDSVLDMLNSYDKEINRELMNYCTPIVRSGGLVPTNAEDVIGDY